MKMKIGVLTAAALVSLPFVAAAASYQPPKNQTRAQIVWVKPICVEKNRYIGWPTVCRLANGDVMAVFSGDRDEHVCPFGKVQMVRSSDEGKTWTDPVTIANGPIDDRDAGIVQLPDGEIFVTYFTSVAYRAPGILARHPDYKRFDDALSDDVRRASLGNWAVRSRDNGKTWTKPEKLSMRGQTPHGPILLRDGSLLQFGRYFAGRTVISAERSTDGGRTWEMLCSDVPDVNGENAKGQMFHEPHVVELADGTLVGMVRYHGADNCMRETVSKDGGRTWTPMAKSPLVGLPPHLIRLADGKIVCVYGRRLKSHGFGEFAAISDDGGATWDYANEISLAPSHCGDLGYPASCVLASGDILTVFYQQPEPGQKPCLMAARWRVKRFHDELPVVDLTRDESRQTVIAMGTLKVYQGHPTTLLTPDGKTLYCVWTINHGGGCGPAARSDDGGRTWTRIDELMPAQYKFHRNCPTLQTVPRPDGSGVNFCIFSANREPGTGGGLGIVVSRDGGRSWSAGAPATHLSAGMPPTGLVALKDGTSALFGQVFKSKERAKDRPTDDQAVWMSVTKDGGITWGAPRIVAAADNKNLCEPFAFRSPDGGEIGLLMRENRHTARSMMCFSRDEGRTWTAPVDTCWGLTGDRHEGVQLPDGRWVIAFRDRALGSSTYGQYVAWVGTYDDLRNGRPGQYRIHLLRSWSGSKHGGWLGDTGYSGVELLPDGTILCTTYVKMFPDERLQSVACTRFRISETDRMARR